MAASAGDRPVPHRRSRRGCAVPRAAVRLEPANIGFAVFLARALIDSSRPDEVLAMAKPSRRSPATLALWHARAEAASATGNPIAEIEAWNNIVSATPADAKSWINLARTLLKSNEFRQAQNAYERALTLSDDIEAFEELGLIYERTNQLEAFGGLLEKADERGIGERLTFLRSLHRYRQGQIGEARELLSRSSPARDPVRWHRLRANIADREGDAATAFAASVEVNRLTNDFEVWRDRARRFRNHLRELADSISSANVPKPSSIGSSGPAFIVGFPRSGTTLLDTFLMGHTSITVIEEKEILRQVMQAHRALRGSEALERARSQYLRLLAKERASGPGVYVIDKDPLNMLAPHLIAAMFPQSPIIFVQRHPCDAVLSCFMQSFVPNLGMANFLDLSDAADFYDAAMTVWTAANAKLPLNVHTVVYEHLVHQPEPQLRAAVRFLGLDWQDKLLDHRATAATRGAIMNTSYNQVTEKLNAAAVGRWRRYETQLQEVLPTLLPWAKRLGY